MSCWRKNAIACKNSGCAMSPLAKPVARSSVAIADLCLIGFMGNSNPALNLTPCMNFSRLKPTQPKSAKIESEQAPLIQEYSRHASRGLLASQVLLLMYCCGFSVMLSFGVLVALSTPFVLFMLTD